MNRKLNTGDRSPDGAAGAGAADRQGEIDLESLASSLKERKELLQLSERKMAAELGLTHATLRLYLAGHRPNIDAYFKMTRWLGVPPETFLPGAAAHNVGIPRSLGDPQAALGIGTDETTSLWAQVIAGQARAEEIQARIESAITEIKDVLSHERLEDPGAGTFDPDQVTSHDLADFIDECVVHMKDGATLAGAVVKLSEEGRGQSKRIATYAKASITPLADALRAEGGALAVTSDEWLEGALAGFPPLDRGVGHSSLMILARGLNESVAKELTSWLRRYRHPSGRPHPG